MPTTVLSEAKVRIADINTIYEYNYWANKRVLAFASKVSEQQFVAPTAFPHGSLRGTLLHIMDAEYGWRELLQHGREADDLAEKDFQSLAPLETRWREEETAMRAYLAGMDDYRMGAIMRYTNSQGTRRERVIWHCLFHVVNHGTQHRSEAAAMLTDVGQSPGDLDFSIFTLENLQQAR